MLPTHGVIYSYQRRGLLSQFPPFLYFSNFSALSKTLPLLDITFIFDRCRCSSAAVVPVKYKSDSNNLTGTFARSKILLTEKFTKIVLVTPYFPLQGKCKSMSHYTSSVIWIKLSTYQSCLRKLIFIVFVFLDGLVMYSIIMLMKLADLSQSNCWIWVMWQRVT